MRHRKTATTVAHYGHSHGRRTQTVRPGPKCPSSSPTNTTTTIHQTSVPHGVRRNRRTSRNPHSADCAHLGPSDKPSSRRRSVELRPARSRFAGNPVSMLRASSSPVRGSAFGVGTAKRSRLVGMQSSGLFPAQRAGHCRSAASHTGTRLFFSHAIESGDLTVLISYSGTPLEKDQVPAADPLCPSVVRVPPRRSRSLRTLVPP